MIPLHDSVDSMDVTEEILADLVEELTTRLQSGQAVDVEELAEVHPAYAERLRQLFPALQALAEAGSSSANGSACRRPTIPETGPLRGTLGDYRILREIGRGGMGIVYEAHQISLDRRVALKVLPFAAALDPRQLQRFTLEAKAAAQLHHSNIVPVFAVGVEQGAHYYAMQYIEGQSLACLVEDLKRLADSRPSTPPSTIDQSTSGQKQTQTIAALSTEASSNSPRFFRTIAQWAVQAAEALEYAHQFGVVHRDIKPANLLIDVRGNLWVTDFGLARFINEIGQTGTGDLVGTLRYMSPEQAEGKAGVVDQRTDIYGLGVTLYELLTLQPAFSGGDRHALLLRIAWEEVLPLRRLNKSIPVELETIVLKALAKTREERYGTARELADDLRRFLTDKPILARRPSLVERSRKWARRHKTAMRALASVMIVVMVCLAVSNFLVGRQRDKALEGWLKARRATDKMYTDVAQKWLGHQPHLQPLQREFLQEALQFYKDFAREYGANPALRLETAVAEHRVADIQQKLGANAEAVQAYGQALASLEALAADFPAVPEYRIELARCQNDWGNWLREQERLPEAEAAYRQALMLFSELALNDPDQAELWDALAGCSNNLGIVLAASKRPEEAEKTYRHALTIFSELAAEHPENPGYRHDLASSQNNLANLLREAGRQREAEQYFAEALLLWGALAKDFPDRPIYRQALASAWHGMGLLLKESTRPQEAEKCFQQSLVLRERLVEDHPSVPAYRFALAASLNQMGSFMAERGRTGVAQEDHRKALKLLVDLATAYPEIPTYQAELAACRKYVNEGHEHGKQTQETHKHLVESGTTNPPR